MVHGGEMADHIWRISLCTDFAHEVSKEFSVGCVSVQIVVLVVHLVAIQKCDASQSLQLCLLDCIHSL